MFFFPTRAGLHGAFVCGLLKCPSCPVGWLSASTAPRSKPLTFPMTVVSALSLELPVSVVNTRTHVRACAGAQKPSLVDASLRFLSLSSLGRSFTGHCRVSLWTLGRYNCDARAGSWRWRAGALSTRFSAACRGRGWDAVSVKRKNVGDRVPSRFDRRRQGTRRGRADSRP